MTSVVVVSHNEGPWLRRTVAGLLAGLADAGEVVVVDDASTDGSAAGLEGDRVRVIRPEARLGIARARNLGAAWARGDLLIFCDAHVDVGAGFAGPLRDALDRPGAGAAGPAIADVDRPEARAYGFRWADATLTPRWLGWPGPEAAPVPMLGGAFLAIRAEVFRAAGGFDPGLILFGCEDAELALRLWTGGRECLVVPAVEVAHQFRRVHPYAVPWAAILHNLLRVAVVHLGPERTRQVVARIAGHAAFPAAFARLADGDAWERRRDVRAGRCRDDDWFFARFGMDW